MGTSRKTVIEDFDYPCFSANGLKASLNVAFNNPDPLTPLLYPHPTHQKTTLNHPFSPVFPFSTTRSIASAIICPAEQG